MGNNQSHPPNRPGSGATASHRGRDRAMSNAPMDIDGLSESSVASGSGSQGSLASNPAQSSRSESPEPDLGLAVTSHATSRRRRYQESTSTASSSRSRIDRSRSSQKSHPDAGAVASRPSIGRRISSAFGRRSSSRRTSPLPRNGEGSTSGLHANASEIPVQEQTQEKLEADRTEGKRDRSQRGQGETKRRKTTGVFSPTLSRTNSAPDSGGEVAEVHLSSEPSTFRISEADMRQEVVSTSAGLRLPSEADTGTEPTERATVDISTVPSEEQKAGDEPLNAARQSDGPAGLPGSPPIVPLTETDPLLNDRLRTLSTIWEVLGSDVARSLPDVATAEAVRRASVTAPRSEIEDAVPETAAEIGISPEDLASLPALPPSTISLLDDLEADTRSRNATSLGLETAVSLDSLLGDTSIGISNANPSTLPLTSAADHLGSGPSASSFSEASLQAPAIPRLASRTSADSVATAGSSATTTDGAGINRPNDRRRGRMGGLAERVGSWFGIGTSDSAQDASGSSEDPPRQSTAPVPDETASQGNADTTQRDPRAPQRLQQGAVMIVQGFVQTSMPRERSGNDIHSTDALGGAEDTPLSSSFPPGQRLDNTPEQRETHDQPQAAQDRNAAGLVSNPPRPAPMSRRASEGEHPHVRPESSRRPSIFNRRGLVGRQSSSRESETPSFTDQARMLAGLLSVATAATASSLLALPAGDNPPAAGPNEAPPEPQSGPGATLAALRRRLQNSSANSVPAPQEDNGLESVLRSYMQRAMSGNQETASTTTSATVSHEQAERQPPSNNTPSASGESEQNIGLATILPDAEASSFEEFLNNMQYSLIQSLREFNNDPTLPASRETPTVPRGSETATNRAPVDERNSPSYVETPIQAVPSPMDVDEGSGVSAPAVPAGADGSHTEVLDDEDGPPRLSFFRMFQFPARDQPPTSNTSSTGEESPPTSLIPAVIVGVRSINRDISTINGETATQAPFPFSDAADMQNQAQTEAEPVQSNNTEVHLSENSAPDEPLVDVTDPSVNVPTEHRSRIMRALRALVQRDEQRARQQAEAARRAAAFVTHNYVIWVVGGNYPAGHPILTIPHLFTGELSHDDLWALSEALGQHKPPVATKDDIAKAGLQVIKGSDIPTAVQDGRVHEMCLDRCLVCLSDYEYEEDCRVMTCKHAFHVECIDRWLETGRNSCPACRQAGVKTSSASDTNAPNPVIPTDRSEDQNQQHTQTSAVPEEVSSGTSSHDISMA